MPLYIVQPIANNTRFSAIGDGVVVDAPDEATARQIAINSAISRGVNTLGMRRMYETATVTNLTDLAGTNQVVLRYWKSQSNWILP
jgi:hypothetical protein